MADIERFVKRDDGVVDSWSVTPDDEEDLANVAHALYVGTSGDVKVMFESGAIDTLTNLAAGGWHHMHIKRVYATDTTAVDIHAGR